MALSSGLLLDTHTLFWIRQGKLAAPPGAMQTIRAAANENNWFVSSMSLYELANASGRKRIDFEEPPLDWFRAALASPGPRLLDITPEIAVATIHLPKTFHGDPGDRILAATAIVENLTICTHDTALLRFGRQGLFNVLKVNEKNEKNAR